MVDEVDPAVVEAFARDGGNCVRGALNPAHAPGRFFEDFCRWPDVPAIERLAHHSRLAAIATALLATPRVRRYHDHVLVKEGGTLQRTHWHQDQPYDNVAGRGVSAWIPVDPVPEGGCLELVATSHRGPWLMPSTFLTGGPDTP